VVQEGHSLAHPKVLFHSQWALLATQWSFPAIVVKAILNLFPPSDVRLDPMTAQSPECDGMTGLRCIPLLMLASGLSTLVAHSQERLPLPNTIVGHVTGSDGRPVRGVLVTLVERDTMHGVPRFHLADVRLRVLTDNEGRYQISNARLGEFYVVAIPQNPVTTPDGHINRSGYRVTYHPSATAPVDAAPVTVNVKSPVSADIQLVPSALSVLSGTIVDSKGQPVKEGILGLAHGDNLFGVDSKGIRIRSDGSFVAPAVPPGTYFLQFRESQWPPPRGEIPLVSGAKVIVTSGDIAGVRVLPIHMAHAAGQITIDPAPGASLQPSEIHVSGSPVNFDGNPGPERAGDARENLAFEFRTWPGPHYIRVTIARPGWTPKAIRYKGSDVTATGIDFKDGEEVSGIEIELTRSALDRGGSF
jgi:hypothetical protein